MRITGFSFLGVCVVLAILLLTKVISIITSGAIFAVALVTFGLLSHGSGKQDRGSINP
ncbi:MAG TPA: hypothetical protein VLX91_06915 [Candidatus Acidoferrales bacterium]|nr:hypothetical protein [Candidatus Acidoferrales bacterium]